MIGDTFYVPIAPMPTYFPRSTPSNAPTNGTTETDSTPFDDSSLAGTINTGASSRIYPLILPKFDPFAMPPPEQRGGRGRSRSLPEIIPLSLRSNLDLGPSVRRGRRRSTTAAPTSHKKIDYELDEVKEADREEYRRRIHLRCEHRRRDAIAVAMTNLQNIITQVTGLDTDRMTRLGIVQEATRLVIGLKDKRARLAAEKDKLLATFEALKKGDKEALKNIEYEWQARQLGGNFATNAGGDMMISGDEDIPLVNGMIDGSTASMIVGQGRQWMDAMNGTGFRLAMEGDVPADTTTTRSASVSMEQLSVAQEQNGRLDINGTSAVREQQPRRTVRIGPRKVGR